MTAAATTAAAAAAFPYLAKEDDARLVAAAGFAFGFEGIDDSSSRAESPSKSCWKQRILERNSLAQHWARDWRALALTNELSVKAHRLDTGAN